MDRAVEAITSGYLGSAHDTTEPMFDTFHSQGPVKVNDSQTAAVDGDQLVNEDVIPSESSEAERSAKSVSLMTWKFSSSSYSLSGDAYSSISEYQIYRTRH